MERLHLEQIILTSLQGKYILCNYEVYNKTSYFLSIEPNPRLVELDGETLAIASVWDTEELLNQNLELQYISYEKNKICLLLHDEIIKILKQVNEDDTIS